MGASTQTTSTPPRPGPRSHPSQALALSSLGLVATQAVVGPGATSTVRAGLVCGAAVAWLVAVRSAAPARAITTLAGVLLLVVATGLLWQAAMALTLIVFLGWARASPVLRPSEGWRSRGSLPIGPTMLVAGVTPFALTAWLVVFDPDLSDVVATYDIDRWPLPLLIAGAIVFALSNAILEELLWRGLLQDRLEPLLGVGAAVALQGISFGLQHWHGFPRGPIGALLAGGWGVMLGVLRRRSRGLLAPVVAHVVADAVIATLLLLRCA